MKFAVRKVVALLLAMLMLVSSMASFAEGTVEYSDTVSSYTLNPDADAADEAIQEVYDEYIAELKAMTSYADRYAWLYSAKYEPASDLGDYFYADFIAYYNEKEPTGDAMCVCAEPLVYGADGHTEGCRWNINNLVTVPGASASSGSASVSGELPAGATLSASSKSTPAAFTGLFEADKGAYTDTQYNSYDLKIMVGDQQWQPGSKVAVTLSNVWSGEGTPAVYVYHFIDVASAIDSDCIISYDSALVSAYPEAAAAANEKGYANAVAYEVLSTIDGTATYKAETNSVSFSLDSFSYVVTGASAEAYDAEMADTYQDILDEISNTEMYPTMDKVYAYFNDYKANMPGGLDAFYTFYEDFVLWYKSENPTGTMICTCTTREYNDDGTLSACPPYAYNTTDHEATCPWHSDNIGDNTIFETIENRIKISATGDIPEGAKLLVNPEDEAIVTAIADAVSEWNVLDEVLNQYAFDISISLNDEEWQPSTPVQVSVEGLDVTAENAVQVFHILSAPADGSAKYTFEVVDSDVGEGMVTFVADGFSTYFIASGSMAIGNKEDRGQISNNTNDTYYTIPGATLFFFVNTSNNVTWTTTLPSGITGTYTGIRYENKPAYQITIPETFIPAAGGTSFTLNATWRGSWRNYSGKVTVVVLSRQEFIDKILNTDGSPSDYNNKGSDYAVYLAVLQNKETFIGIPNEPAQSGAGYNFIEEGYTIGDKANDGDRFRASDYYEIIDTSIGGHADLSWSVDGSNTVGLVDPSGVKTKAMLKGIDWDAVLDAVFAERSGTWYDTDGNVVDESKKEEYEVIPYVIKLETTNDMQGWHIDCCVRKKTAVTLTYDSNIPSGLKLDTSITMPNNVTKPKGSEVTIGSISGMNNGKINVSGIQDTTEKYEFTFVGWNTEPDGSGTMYSPNVKFELNENTTLYAIWNSNPAIGTGDLLIRKTVVTAAGEAIDADQSFTFTVSISNAGESATYRYTIYNANNIAVSGGTGTISSGGTISLKHGQYVIIEDVPAVNETNGAANITVTETMVSGYTPSWYSSSTASASTTVKIEGGRRSELTCTNTKATPKVEVALKKLVEGNVGDRSKVFDFTVKSADGTIIGTFELKNEDTTSFTVEVGTTISIVESSAGYETKASTTNISNAVTKVDVKQNSDKMTATLDPIMVTNDLSLITVTNTKDITVDTGILLDSAPYVLLLALVGAGIAFMIIRRRRRED